MKQQSAVIFSLWLLVALALPAGSRAFALEIQSVTSTRGVTGWLAEDHGTSVVALRFAFTGGSAEEHKDQSGITRILARLLARGYGRTPDQSFQRRAQQVGLRVNFQAGRDALYGSIDIPAPNLAAGKELLADMFATADIDAQVLEDIRALVRSSIEAETSDPRAIASDTLYAHGFTGHGYAKASGGEAGAVSAITAADIAALRGRLFVRRNLVVTAAGDIARAQLASLLDAMFGHLPDLPRATPERPRFQPGPDIHVSTSAAAAVIAFAFPAVDPTHPDFTAARVLAHIIGSGDLESRLLDHLRVRHGLAYSAQMSLVHDRLATLMLGEIVTSPERAEAALAGLRSVLDAARAGPYGDEEISTAKSALAGADVLALDSTGRIADAMLAANLDGEGADFLDRRSVSLREVTAEQVRRMARQLLAPDKILVSIVSGKTQ